MKEGTLIKTDLKFISINEFRKLMVIFNNKELDSLEKNIGFLSILTDMTTEEIENLDLEVFQDLISKTNINDFINNETDFINEVVVNGIAYKTRSNGNDFKYNVKEINILKNTIKTYKDDYILDLAAIIFKEDGGLLTAEAINTRKEILKDHITMYELSPYINVLSKYLNVSA